MGVVGAGFAVWPLATPEPRLAEWTKVSAVIVPDSRIDIGAIRTGHALQVDAADYQMSTRILERQSGYNLSAPGRSACTRRKRTEDGKPDLVAE